MKSYLLLGSIMVVIGLGIGFSINASAEENLIPFWIKSSAQFWIDGKISDGEFMKSIEYLINNKVISIPDKSYSKEYDEMKKRVNSLELQNRQLLDRLYNLGDKGTNNSNNNSNNNYNTQTEEYTADSKINIGGLNSEIKKFGFMSQKPNIFSIDMAISYSRSGTPVEFEVTQIRVTTSDHFSYETKNSEFKKFNGIYKKDTIMRGIVSVDDVPKNLEKDLEILVFVREIQNGYYVQDYIFTHTFTLLEKPMDRIKVN